MYSPFIIAEDGILFHPRTPLLCGKEEKEKLETAHSFDEKFRSGQTTTGRAWTRRGAKRQVVERGEYLHHAVVPEEGQAGQGRR
mmetsp:Transcript_25868/g.59072  ORF Transcript_25868/g.59072 Transcript_25868/m.59072 type:complete len:84 (-) Transcript_25868:26-277(-)